MKQVWVAYLLWFFLGLIGAHKFYLGRYGMGFIYLFTGGVFGVGVLIDLFTLVGQVNAYNAQFVTAAPVNVVVNNVVTS
jgi:TM2 domain-containing membrane protein YozV